MRYFLNSPWHIAETLKFFVVEVVKLAIFLTFVASQISSPLQFGFFIQKISFRPFLASFLNAEINFCLINYLKVEFFHLLNFFLFHDSCVFYHRNISAFFRSSMIVVFSTEKNRNFSNLKNLSFSENVYVFFEKTYVNCNKDISLASP